MSWLTWARPVRAGHRTERSDLGTTTAEYALVLAGVAGAVVLAFALLVPAVGDLFGRAICALGVGCEGGPTVAAELDPWDDPDPVRRATWGKVVILGDSYSSGEGAEDYGAGASDAGCHASEHAYGPTLARRLDVEDRSLRVVACTGATLANIAGRYSDHRQPPQLGGIDEDTSLVALSIGGNDVGWGDAIASCIQQTLVDLTSDCRPGTKRARDIEATIEGMRPRLTAAYRAIAAKAPHARIVAMSYPKFFPDDADGWLWYSGGAPVFGASNQRWANDMTERLNGEMAHAAKQAGVEFVDASDAFAGHELTSADPWFHGMDLDLGTKPWFWGLRRPTIRPNASSFHPTAEGQRALANLMEEQIRHAVRP